MPVIPRGAGSNLCAGTVPLADPDPLIEAMIEALKKELADKYDLTPADLHPSTLEMAAKLKRDYEPRV